MSRLFVLNLNNFTFATYLKSVLIKQTHLVYEK